MRGRGDCAGPLHLEGVALHHSEHERRHPVVVFFRFANDLANRRLIEVLNAPPEANSFLITWAQSRLLSLKGGSHTLRRDLSVEAARILQKLEADDLLQSTDWASDPC